MEANKKNLYRHVDFLTSIYPYRNYKNVESLNKSANYIEEEFKKTGLPTSRQAWIAKGNTYENIIATYQPNKTKRFIIGAHYDVYKDQPGADDNASSVAGLLEIARMLTKSGLELDYGIDFVSYCLEEPPFFKKKEMGSYVHAKSIDYETYQYIGMISLEMIGYYRERGDNSKIDGYSKSRLIVSGIKSYDDFNRRISELIRTKGKIDSTRVSFADDYPNNGPSDHRNYWEYGVPAVMLIGTAGYGNPHYHKKTDTIETLDFATMTDAVNSIAYILFNF